MSKVKIGDKVRLVNKPIWVGAYQEGDTGVVVAQDSMGFSATFGYVLVALDNGIYSIPHGQYEVIADEQKKGSPEYPLEKDISAETIRSNILSIRKKRNDLLMEIAALDKEEAKLVEKLKQQGFVLYEQNEPETLATQSVVATEKKSVLYAEDIEEDMTSPKNWEIGDLVEAINNSSDSAYRAGEVYEISWLQWRSVDDCVVNTSLDSNECSTNGWGSTNFKFHSRPVVK